jgi:hypothetical protein
MKLKQSAYATTICICQHSLQTYENWVQQIRSITCTFKQTPGANRTKLQRQR